jgi:hypothetical protein
VNRARLPNNIRSSNIHEERTEGIQIVYSASRDAFRRRQQSALRLLSISITMASSYYDIDAILTDAQARPPLYPTKRRQKKYNSTI